MSEYFSNALVLKKHVWVHFIVELPDRNRGVGLITSLLNLKIYIASFLTLSGLKVH